MNKQKHTYLSLDSSLGLLSAAIIAYQIVLMQVLSIQQWHYMAFMIISVALLGFGTSGTIIALYRDKLLQNFDKHYSILLFLSSISMAAAPIIGGSKTVQYDTYLLFIDPIHIIKFIVTCFLYFIPFLFGAIAIGLTFTQYANRIGKLYFANLIGSGTGGILTVLIMWVLLPHKLVLLIAILPLIAGLIFTKIRKHYSIMVLASVIIITSWFIAKEFTPSQYKSWSKTMNLPEAKIIWQQNSPYGLVQKVTSPVIRYAPSLSLKYSEPIPHAGSVFINGEEIGYFPAEKNTLFTVLKFTPGALAYHLESRKKLLVINAGMGEHIQQGILHQVKSITAVDSNPILIRMCKSIFEPWSKQIQLQLDSTNIRSFLKKDTAKYDVIIYPPLGSLYGTTGLYAMEEQNHLTTEAFSEAWEHLSKDGVLSISCWLDYPFRTTLKLIASINEVLEEKVDSVYKHVLLVKNWNQIAVFIKKSPLTTLEKKKAHAFCDSMLFDLISLTKEKVEYKSVIHETADPNFNNYLNELFGQHKNEFINTYPFRIRPATDNQPYFSQFLKFSSIQQVLKNYNLTSIPYFELGYLIVLLTLFLVFLSGFLIIFLPLKFVRHKKLQSGYILYFASIGVGYMVTEMVCIHLFNMYFPNPVFSMSIIIAILLITSGIGSYLSDKLVFRKQIWFFPCIVSIVLILYMWGLPTLIDQSMAYSFFYKIILSVFVIGAIGFFMGIPFPSAIGLLSIKYKNSIPVAWAVNGYFSVIATPLAVLLTIEIGFSGLFAISALSYLTASIIAMIAIKSG
jgi:hypothetical protein